MGTFDAYVTILSTKFGYTSSFNLKVIKMSKINYKELTIQRLQEETNMTAQEATSYFNRVYNSALHSADKAQRIGLNVTRELYSSLFYHGQNVFQLDGENNRVVLNPIFEKSKSIKQDATFSRMESFFNKYKDSKFLKEQRQLYQSGQITKKEFNSRIKGWKKVNTKYLVSGS